MKTIKHIQILILIIFLFDISFLNSQTLIPVSNEIVLPQYAVNGSTTASRIMYICRLKLTGLTASTTYRYATGASTNGGLTTAIAAGNLIAINEISNSAGYIVGYSAGKSSFVNLLDNNSWNTSGSSNNYAQFTSNASGEYTGWFAFVPTGNAVFTAGNSIYIYIQINNGAGGTSIAASYRTTSTVTMLAYGTSSGSSTQCTAIYANSYVPDENFIFLYDNINGTGRPLSGTWSENDGLAQDWTTWYTTYVSTNLGYWGTVLPNNLVNGLRRIERRDITNTILNQTTDDNGIWPSGTNTINPSGGTLPINLSDATLPVRLLSYTYNISGNSVMISWKTSFEMNNNGFEIYRTDKSGWLKIGFVKGKGNSTEINSYNFTDRNLIPGEYKYRLKQIDVNGNYEYFDLEDNVIIAVPSSFLLSQNYPNPFNPTTKINITIPKDGFVSLKVYDISGKEIIDLVNKNLLTGTYVYDFNASNLSSGIYFYTLKTSEFSSTKKMILIK